MSFVRLVVVFEMAKKKNKNEKMKGSVYFKEKKIHTVFRLITPHINKS